MLQRILTTSHALYCARQAIEVHVPSLHLYSQFVKSLTVKINDKTLYEFVEPEGTTGTRKIGKGSFALQAHDPKSVVRYKNIMVKALPD